MNKANVVYVANDNYAVLAGVSMISLFENNKNVKNLSVYILSDCISDINLFNLQEIGYKYQRKVCIVDISNELSDMMNEFLKKSQLRSDVKAAVSVAYKLLLENKQLKETISYYENIDSKIDDLITKVNNN